MSSEGSETISSGSRIRQFGLYRTIDARTEEFLRLSRKRQIKQGCACAAVSTAITVTVVISVLLVYEYSINAGSNSSKILTLKSNWYGLLNETADGTALDAKFAQKKINFDSTTLKLLPVLLKALNQNRYLEKIIDDYSSSSPTTYEKKKESTEFRFKKNIFVNERWAKMPTSRLFTLEYKTSPLVYYKSPTITNEYFTKIRKIRDYQRMLNYFDKMVNEKVKTGSTLPMINIKDISSEKPYIKTVTKPMATPWVLYDKKMTTSKTHADKEVKTTYKKDKTNCTCSNKRSELLKKVMSSIKLMMLDIENSKSPCEESKKQESLHSNPPDNSIQHIFSKNTTDKWISTTEKLEIASKTKLHSDYKIDISTHMNNIKINPVLRMPFKPNLFDTNMDYQLKNKNNMYKPFYKGLPSNRLNIKADDEITTTKSNTIYSATTINDLIEINYTKLSNKSEKDDQLIGHNIRFQNSVPKQKTRFHEPVPIFSDIEYDDYFSSTPKADNDTDIDFGNLDVHSMELMKSKKTLVRKNNTYQDSIKIKPIKPTNDYDISENENSSLFFIDKMVTVIFPTLQIKIQNDTSIDAWKPKAKKIKNITKIKPNYGHNQHETTTPEEKKYKEVADENTIKDESINTWRNIVTNFHNMTKIKTKTNNNMKYQHETTTPEEEIYKKIPDENTKDSESTNTWKNIKTNFQNITKIGTKTNHNIQYQHETTIPDEEIEKIVPDEELQEAETTRPTFVFNKTASGIEISESLRDILKSTGESRKYTSMLPINRPVYLEINRNDWRQDDHQDFDINLNNNNFDFSNWLKK